jgi:hypothetical protein
MFFLCSKLGMTYIPLRPPPLHNWIPQARRDAENRRLAEVEEAARIAAKNGAPPGDHPPTVAAVETPDAPPTAQAEVAPADVLPPHQEGDLSQAVERKPSDSLDAEEPGQPERILSQPHSGTGTGTAPRSGVVKGDGEAAEGAALAEGQNPPRDGEVAARSADGGGSPPGAAPEGPPDDSRLHHRSASGHASQPDGPPPSPRSRGQAGEDPADADAERIRIMGAWMNKHWDTVEAMARAGEVPERPAPPPPRPDPEAGPAERPQVHVARGDRWNKPKMADFLRHLAATHSVTAAARAVGMSRNSAYKLRARLKGQPFDIAWEAAFRHGYDDLAQAALEMALEGEEVPHYHKGELVGTHRKRNPQLVIGLLKMRNRAGAPTLGRYGAAAEFWSEHWDTIVDRVETGSVTWDDERRALGEEELKRLDLPDAKREIDGIIVRNLPDEPRGPGKP